MSLAALYSSFKELVMLSLEGCASVWFLSLWALFYQACGLIPEFLWVLAASGSQLPSALQNHFWFKSIHISQGFMCSPSNSVSLQPITNWHEGTKASSLISRWGRLWGSSRSWASPWDQSEVRLQLRPQSYLSYPASLSPFLLRALPSTTCIRILLSGSASREPNPKQWCIEEHWSCHLLSSILSLQHIWNTTLTTILKSGQSKTFDLPLAKSSLWNMDNWSRKQSSTILTLLWIWILSSLKELGSWKNWGAELWPCQSGMNLPS